MSANRNSVTIFRDGQQIGQADLQPNMVIGRSATAQLQLEDTTLSREHAVIIEENGNWFLIDKSSYGTWLDRKRLEPSTPTPIGPASVANVGNLELRFSVGTAEAAQPAAAAVPVAPRPDIERTPESSPLLEDLVERQSEIPIWSKGLIELRVADIVDETEDTKTFRMVGLKPVLFSFKPGQFVTLRLPIDGKEVARSYSISSSPSRPHCLELTVKRVPGGLVSNWMCDHLKLGDVVKARGPAGHFSCFNYPSNKILFIGAGSGITPVVSMLRWIVDTAAEVDAYLFVSARRPSDIIFRNELNWMSSRHSGIRVGITCTGRAAGSEAWTGVTGRCNANMLKMMVPDMMERHVFMCGPEPFMDAVTESLRDFGFPIENLHVESFGAARVAPKTKVTPSDVKKSDTGVSLSREALAESQLLPPVAPAPASETPPETPSGAPSAVPSGAPSEAPASAPASVAAAATGFTVKFAQSDVTVQTEGDATLLELAEANGVEIDYQCRAGSCGRCLVKCSSGDVDMDEDCAIDDDEKDEGFIYACCAEPISDVVLDC